MIYFESNFMVSQNNIILYTWYLSNSLSLKIICLLHPFNASYRIFHPNGPLMPECKNAVENGIFDKNFEIFESKLSIRAWLKSNVCPPLNDGSKIKQFMVFRLRQAYCGFTKMRFYQFRNNL